MLLGAGGMLGADLAATSPAGVDLHRFTHTDLDITDAPALEGALDAVQPAAVVNAAAYTAVDRAEAERPAAFAINGAAVAALARLCAGRGVRLVHFSTDYVFDGTGSRPYREDDQVAPINAYGESKLAGERAALATGGDALVIRTQWLFGVNGRSFPRTMWERARRGDRTRVVSDQRGRLTFTQDLAEATWQLLLQGHTGLFHVANGGETTWFNAAERIFSVLGVRDRLSPCTTAEYATPARRPAYSLLDTSKLERTLGSSLPDGLDALGRFLALLEVSHSGASV